tara:strand:- start:172 stop:414 length:243 start_codon:yes stop_codon:yes gene_type:complete
MNQIITEAIVVGIITVIIGNISGLLVASMLKVNLPEICKDWNKYYTMEITLFLTGVLIHLLCEFIGINKWYCKNGNACLI